MIPGFRTLKEYATHVQVGYSTVLAHMKRGVCAWPRIVKDGKSANPLYRMYAGMKDRCSNPNNPGFKDYGGRGITVSSSWLTDFNQFVSDMGPRPLGYTIERVDNNLGYSVANCVWASPREQTLNQRSNALSPNIRQYSYGSYLAHIYILGVTHTGPSRSSLIEAELDLKTLKDLYAEYL